MPGDRSVLPSVEWLWRELSVRVHRFRPVCAIVFPSNNDFLATTTSLALLELAHAWNRGRTRWWKWQGTCCHPLVSFQWPFPGALCLKGHM